MFPDIEIKPKKYHSKCEGCEYVPICGEGEYLRLSASGSLDPCMYRDDLKQNIHGKETSEHYIKKVALGFRRIHQDSL